MAKKKDKKEQQAIEPVANCDHLHGLVANCDFQFRQNGSTACTESVSATIHTRYSEQFLTDLKKHNEQYPEIKFIQIPHRNHDRFLIRRRIIF